MIYILNLNSLSLLEFHICNQAYTERVRGIMDFVQLVGYLAALLMFSTFYMKKMIPLRAVGICSNIAFIIFAGSSGVYPLLILHICLLPLNTIRMVQMIKLVKEGQRVL